MTLKIHPFADRFPMWPQEKLQELAGGIHTYGQQTPIMLDQTGQLLDGRNRLAACELLKIEPKFATLPKDEDPIDFIVMMNLMSQDARPLSASQRAMLFAIAYPEAKITGRPRKNKGLPGKPLIKDAFSKTALAMARTVLKYFDGNADHSNVAAIVAGGSLKDAYEWVQAEKLKELTRQQELKELEKKNANPDEDEESAPFDFTPKSDPALEARRQELERELQEKKDLRRKALEAEARKRAEYEANERLKKEIAALEKQFQELLPSDVALPDIPSFGGPPSRAEAAEALKNSLPQFNEGENKKQYIYISSVGLVIREARELVKHAEGVRKSQLYNDNDYVDEAFVKIIKLHLAGTIRELVEMWNTYDQLKKQSIRRVK